MANNAPTKPMDVEAKSGWLVAAKRSSLAKSGLMGFEYTDVGWDLQPMYVVLAGPDGCGKSTLAQQLSCDSTNVIHRHWRPGLLPGLNELRGGVEDGTNADPHARIPDNAIKATVRTVYYWLDFVLGYLFLIRPCVRKGHIFLIERGWDDVTIDPLRYGLRGAALARTLSRLTPHPDLTLLLDLDPALARLRKPEITEVEIARQLKMWRKLEGERNLVVLDGSADIDIVHTRARAELERQMGR